MSYGDIYEDVCQCCWPGVNVPENMVDYVRKRIRHHQRNLNRKYNFWFTLFSDTIETEAGVSVYDLDVSIKKIESLFWTIDGQGYTSPELKRVDLIDHSRMEYLFGNNTEEYPVNYRDDGSSITLYPAASSVRTLNVLYWGFLDVVPLEEIAFAAYEDDFSTYLAEAIKNFTASDIMLSEKEWQAATMYKQEALEEVQAAILEDTSRRQILETTYRGGR